MPKPDTYGRGFSLIELAVVIAVVMLLLYMMMPALMRARDTANQAACAAKLRSMGTGLQSFLADNRFYPLSAERLGTGIDYVTDVTWAEALYPHIFNRPPPAMPRDAGPEFSCPGIGALRPRGRMLLSYQANSGPQPGTTGVPWDTAQRVSAGFAGLALEEENRNIQITPVPAAYVTVPAGTMFVSDGRLSGLTYLENNTIRMRNASTNTFEFNPHMDKNNFLYSDGHVQLQNSIDTIGAPSGTRGSPRGAWTPVAGD
jgi:prepilin-type N-terminal cleavage/methylation domain-containing protein/prepilin-type processing-associated H-X9-DG protein